jgi:integrase
LSANRAWRKVFAKEWREIARAKNIPDSVQNRGTRAGGATDAEKKRTSLGRIRPALGHSNDGTTQLYLRLGRRDRGNCARSFQERQGMNDMANDRERFCR